MALAYISFAGMNSGQAEFYADIGTNKFYRYRIGGVKNRTNGLDQLDEVTHNSELFEHSDSNPFNSRFMIKVPVTLFQRSREFVQLYSYGDKQGISPAISEATEVNPQADILNNEWPLLTGQSKQMSMLPDSNYNGFNPCRTVSFSFQESKFSTAMFWDTLLKVAKDLAPTAIEAVISLLKSNGGAANTTGSGTPTPAAPGAAPTSDNIMKIISAIAEVISKQAPAAQPNPAPTVTNQPAPNQPAPNPSLTKSLTRETLYSNSFSYKKLRGSKRYRDNKKGFAKQQIIDGGILTGPLLASLLGPLLQSAPQLLQAIGDTPVKWLNAKNEGDLKKQQAEQAYLQNLLAQHNQNVLLQLLANTGQLNKQNPPVGMSFSTNNSITVSFEPGTTVTVSGKQKSVYAVNAPVKLLLHVKTTAKPPSRPIPKAIVQLQLKDALTQKLLLEKKYRMKDVYLNSMLELEIIPQELKHLPLNTDLLVAASFVWPSKTAGRNEGKSNVHAIYLVTDYLLKHFGDKEGADIPLTDMNKYRVFWNKIWEGSARDKRRWETTLDVKYYTYFQPAVDSNARVETKIKRGPQEDEESSNRLITDGKLKSGLEVSPVELNKLIPEISSYPVLTEQQLAALQSDDMQKRFNQEAKVNLRLRGSKDETGAIWAYPEVAIHKVILSKVGKVDEKGQVTELVDEEVYFPCLTHIHFAGVKTI